MIRTRWPWGVLVGAATLLGALALVAAAGTDIPFQDQWDVEGRQLYPAWQAGTLHLADLFHAHNEHRIVWTRLVALALFVGEGQWDPLLQLGVNAFLRATMAVACWWAMTREVPVSWRPWTAAGVAMAFLPHLAWHNVLWGFQSQVYFSIIFSMLALVWLGTGTQTPARRAAGLGAGGAALIAMGSGDLVPVALLGWEGLRAIGQRRFELRRFWPALVLLALAWGLRPAAPELSPLQSTGVTQFLAAWLRALAWPHTGQPLAALVLNAPLVWWVIERLRGRGIATVDGEAAALVGGWAVLLAAAMAWSRGGSGEWIAGVPSRYADFLVLLPLANGWCGCEALRQAAGPPRRWARGIAVVWTLFLAVGWVGLSSEAMQRVILPRARDRDAPVRLAVALQRSGDPAVLAGQPRLLSPHPDPAVVLAVLNDPQLRGRLPPSLQPDRPLGTGSRWVRAILRRQ